MDIPYLRVGRVSRLTNSPSESGKAPVQGISTIHRMQWVHDMITASSMTERNDKGDRCVRDIVIVIVFVHDSGKD